MSEVKLNPHDLAGQVQLLQRKVEALERARWRDAADARRSQGYEAIVADEANLLQNGFVPADIAGSYGPELVFDDIPIGTGILVAADAEIATPGGSQGRVIVYQEGLDQAASQMTALERGPDQDWGRLRLVPGNASAGYGIGGVWHFRAAATRVVIRLRYGTGGTVGASAGFRNRHLWTALFVPRNV